MILKKNNSKILNLIRCSTFFNNRKSIYYDNARCGKCILSNYATCFEVADAITRNIIRNVMKDSLHKIPHVLQLIDVDWYELADNDYIPDDTVEAEYLLIEKCINENKQK
jgi:hypothetical protein